MPVVAFRQVVGRGNLCFYWAVSREWLLFLRVAAGLLLAQGLFVAEHASGLT